jgi:hypothetical protein
MDDRSTRGDHSVTAVDFVDRAHRWLTTLEDDAKANAPNAGEARLSVARKIGVLPGTLRNLRKKRVKDVSAAVYHNINVAFIRHIEHELRRLIHERHIAIQQGLAPTSPEVAEIETLISEAEAALGLTDAPDDRGA